MTVRLAIVGAGSMAYGYVNNWIKTGLVSIVAIVETDPKASARVANGIEEMTGRRPDIYCSLDHWQREGSPEIDAAYVATPHASHAAQTALLLQAGVDVLLEKPMVTNIEDAYRLVHLVEKTGRILVVAYQGALSELVRKTRSELMDSTYGALLTVSGCIWENWKDRYQTSWKQNPAVSGGGFLFDTGAHLINTIMTIVGSPVRSVSAYQHSLGTDVDIVSVAAGQFENGELFTVSCSGHTQLQQCKSEIILYFERALIRIDAWGRWRRVETATRDIAETFNISEQLIAIFCRIRNGEMENPSDVYQGLQFTRLWDGISESFNSDGRQILISNT